MSNRRRTSRASPSAEVRLMEGRLLHAYASLLYSHAPMTPAHPIPASHPSLAPVSDRLESPAAIATDGSSVGILPRTERGRPADDGAGPRRLRVGIVGATG